MGCCSSKKTGPPKDTAPERREIPTLIPGGEIPSNVKHTESFYTTAKSKLSLFTQEYELTDRPPLGVLFIFHGYGEHTCWLERLKALRFVHAGYKVMVLDLPAHGKSDGLFGYVPDFDVLVDSTYEWCDTIKQRPENLALPHFLVGESMGGALVLRILQRHGQEQWRGAVLLAPMCKIADYMKPPDWQVKGLTYLAGYFPTKRFVPSPEILHKCLQDPVKLALAEQNPLSYGRFYKPRLATALSMLGVTELLDKSMEEITVPFLVMHGEDDVVTDPDASVTLHERASSKDKTLEIRAKCWHVLFEEPEGRGDANFGVCKEWLDTRAVPAPSSSSSSSSSSSEVEKKVGEEKGETPDEIELEEKTGLTQRTSRATD